MVQRDRTYRTRVCDERGSSVAQAAAVAILSAVVIAAMLMIVSMLAPSIETIFACLVRSIMGGGC